MDLKSSGASSNNRLVRIGRIVSDVIFGRGFLSAYHIGVLNPILNRASLPIKEFLTSRYISEIFFCEMF